MRVSQSSHIYGHDYDQDTRTLTVQFTNGAIYQYAGVDPNTYYAFKQSSSPGNYLHSKIIGTYRSQLIAAGGRRRK